MELSAGLGVRWTRAALLALVAMLSGTVAHVSAGGYLPGLAALGWLFLICLLGSAALLGRPASTLRVMVLVMAGQTFIHGALTALAGHRGDPPLSRTSAVANVPAALPNTMPTALGDARRSGSLYDQLYSGRQTSTSDQLSVPAPVQHLLADLTGPHAVMAIAHLAAAALVALWLARGERELWRVLLLASAALQLRLSEGSSGVLGRLARAWSTVLAVLATRVQARRRLDATRRHYLPTHARLERIGTDSLGRRGPPLLVAA